MKPDALIHNAAEDHILQQYDIANPSILVPPKCVPSDDGTDFDFDDFSRSARFFPWSFTSSDNFSAQYRTPRHYNQIASRGSKHKHLSVHTFNASQHGKQQTDPLGGREHALARKAEKKGNPLDTHWRLYDYMTKSHSSCTSKKSGKYSVEGPVYIAYVDDACIDDKDLKNQIEISAEHKEGQSSYLRVDSTVPD